VLVRQRQEVQALSRSLTLSESATSRILDWEGCFNVRDLGGLPITEGEQVRFGALVRSDIPSRLTETGRKSLVEHGVQTIVDLRFKEEVASDWDAYPFHGTDSANVRYCNVPFDTGNDPALRDELRAAYRAAQNRVELNRLDIDLHGAGIAAAVGAIADAPMGGVLVHCHAGKDRTGAVVAVVLALLGVADEDIADDYAMTAINFEPLIVEWLDGITDDLAERDRLRALAMPAREAMLDTLAHLRERYGSAEQYLRAGGVTDEQMDRLRARLIDRG